MYYILFSEDFGLSQRETGRFLGIGRGENGLLLHKGSPPSEREKIGRHRGGCRGKNEYKKGPTAICCEPFSGAIIREICMRLKKRYQIPVSVFFKTHRLSENFVLLSAERCPFSA